MSEGATRYGELVSQHGLSTAQKRSIAWVPAGARVLELGCACGDIGRILIEQKGCSVVGVELDPEAAEQARSRGLQVHVGSLEDEAFRAGLPGGCDVVMATDLLEHLSEPERILGEMPRWLRPGGHAIIATPNVTAWSMRVRLGLRGDFTYQETGVLDRTHLRFFSWDSLHAMVRRQGFTVVDEVVDTWEVPGAQTLLWELPQQLRGRLAGGEAALAEPSGSLASWSFHRLGKLTRLHQNLGRLLGSRWPNLCARHVGLLLRPGPRRASDDG